MGFIKQIEKNESEGRYYPIWNFQCDGCGIAKEGIVRQIIGSENQAVLYLRGCGWTVGKGGTLKCPKCKKAD